MSYRIRFHRKARAELDLCCHRYPCTEEPLWTWLRALADEAEEHEDRLSSDIKALATYLAKAFLPMKTSWQFSHKKFGKATWLDVLKAIVEFVEHRDPPWQLRAAWCVFPVLGGAFHSWPLVFFEVDHVGKQIVIRLFEGLPGQ